MKISKIKKNIENIGGENIMKISRKRIIGILAGVTAATMIFAGSMAYFTDRAVETASGKTESLKIDLSDFNVDLDGDSIISPGSTIPVTYNISNTGSIAADEREKLTLSVWAEDGSPIALSESPSEFEIYNADDVELVEGKGYTVKPGKQPVGSRVTDGFTSEDVNGNMIIYQLEQSVLNGTDEQIEGEDKDELSRDFVILFKNTASNKFQAAKINLNVLVEAKQHTYTGDYDNNWSELQSSSVDIDTGSQTVVPAAE